MYTAVLMLALTTGTETVDFCGRGGCSGCYCSCSCSCYCSSYCSGCWGGGHGRRHGCHGCYSSCHGCYSSYCGCYGGWGCCSSYGGYGCCGGYIGGPGVIGGPGYGAPGGEMVPGPKEKEKVKQSMAPATIIVNLPAGARLTVDGAPTTSTSERRTLVTPDLQVGETYVYTLRAEHNSSAQAQQVTVRGGQTTNVQFNFATQTVASR